jgi:hypothetical protein
VTLNHQQLPAQIAAFSTGTRNALSFLRMAQTLSYQ